VIGFGRWIGAIVSIELPCCLCMLSKFFTDIKKFVRFLRRFRPWSTLIVQLFWAQFAQIKW
jgi:hypothetical protein